MTRRGSTTATREAPGGRPPRARSWFSPQANVTGRGIVAGYTARFWAIVVMVGVIAGAGAAALVGLLHLVEHVAYGYRSGPFLDGVARAPAWRIVAALIVAAGVVAIGILVVGRLRSTGGAEVSEAVWLRGARMSLPHSIVRALVSIITVGLGVSLGREGAPQLVGAATASRLAEWAQLEIWQRRLLVASGAGAGFAAVYNVPLGGSLFALEVLLGTISLPLVLPALATSVTATGVAWIALGTSPTYRLPSYPVHPAQLVWALLVGPVIGMVAIAWVRLIARAGAVRLHGRARFIAPLVVFIALGLLAIPYPQLLGNGKGIVQLEALGGLSLGLLCVLLILKPLVTAACLGAGSPGGLFTPTLTVGVLLSGVLGTIWLHIWPGAQLGAYAIIGGGAFLAAAMQGPLSGVVLVLELTRNFDSLMAPTLLAVVEATVIARRLGAPSIYSARLRPDPDAAPGPPAAEASIAALDAQPEPPGSSAQPPDA
ncbi:MAG: chloride channel protein [Solirubrobacteraceae bacterium]